MERGDERRGAAVPAHAEEPVRVLERGRNPVRRRLRRHDQEGAGQPDDLRRHDRRGHADHRPRRAARRSPGLEQEHRRRPTPIAFTSVDADRQHHRSEAGDGRDRLRRERRRRPGARPRCWCRRSWGRTATTRPSAPTDRWCSTTSRPAPARPPPAQTPDKSCNADTDTTATMFLTPASARRRDADPAHQRQQPGRRRQRRHRLTNSFPKWAPFVVQLDEFHKLYWFTFSSTRQYGLRSPPAPANTSETTKGTLIWMVGVQVGDDGRGPELHRLLPPLPGHHDVQPHRPVDEGVHPRPGLTRTGP